MTFPNSDTMLVIDADILVYQRGFKHEDTRDWWVVERDIDQWIEGWFKKFGTYNYVLYLTGKNNFREEVAISHKYKDRPSKKPKWYKEIRDYLIHCHRTKVAQGREADDEIAMHLTRNPNSIHIGIDKDILQVQGWHYRYATHNSPEVPLRYVERFGELELTESASGKKKLKGTGMIWFYAQMLLGDRTDSIYGPKGYGDIKVWNTLKDCATEKECYDVVKAIYEESFENTEARLKENADLLYMIRELDDKGEPVLWQPPKEVRK